VDDATYILRSYYTTCMLWSIIIIMRRFVSVLLVGIYIYINIL
jgi:hypothetical protein